MAETQIKNIAMTFGAYTALHEINLTIADQELMVVLGASGCSKSTLLRIIAGLETATSGEGCIGGKRNNHLGPKDRGIAMVFQNYAMFPHLTVFANIGFGCRVQKLPNDEVTRQVERVAGLMHIGQLLKRYSGQLSGGQHQRVAAARAGPGADGRARCDPGLVLKRVATGPPQQSARPRASACLG